MKLKTKQITVTAVMIALSIVVIQFIKAPLMIAGQSVAISGALINLILIIDTREECSTIKLFRFL